MKNYLFKVQSRILYCLWRKFFQEGGKLSRFRNGLFGALFYPFWSVSNFVWKSIEFEMYERNFEINLNFSWFNNQFQLFSWMGNAQKYHHIAVTQTILNKTEVSKLCEFEPKRSFLLPFFNHSLNTLFLLFRSLWQASETKWEQ